MEGTLGRIDRNVREIGPPRRFTWVSREEKLRPCSSGSFEKSTPRNNVVRAERHLFRLGEEVIDTAIEHETADTFNGYFFFWDELRRAQNIELKFIGEFVVKELKAQFPFHKSLR